MNHTYENVTFDKTSSPRPVRMHGPNF